MSKNAKSKFIFHDNANKQTNPELHANFKNKKKIAVKFVFEKFLNENAISKIIPWRSIKRNDEKHDFFAVGKVLTISLLSRNF